jgi:NitT/TauT family transport system substrate-binding protein
MVLGSPKFLNERRDVAQRFMAAYLKGVRDYNDVFVKGTGDKVEIINIMTKHTALKDPNVWKKVGVTLDFTAERKIKKQKGLSTCGIS